MASTAHSDPEMVKERYDPPDVLSAKVDRLVDMIKKSEHFVVFTGAGISTSAGIPDFRGPKGKWTLEAQGKKCVSKVSTVEAYPTPTHMALLELYKRGKLKYLISQNCDGLHRRSGMPGCGISELHGNSNIEECEDCGTQYFRDFGCHRRSRARDHYTGRTCTRAGCDGRLLEFTIDFGQNLPERPLNLAYHHAEAADLHFVLGSSLTVSPACDMPRITGAQKGGNLVICNLQLTPLSDEAAMQIFAKTDTVMEMVMKKLKLSIPPFRLQRRVMISAKPTRDHVELCAAGVDIADSSLRMNLMADVVWKTTATGCEGESKSTRQQDNYSCSSSASHSNKTESGFVRKVAVNAVPKRPNVQHLVSLDLKFWGHYHEPNVSLSADLSRAFGKDAEDCFLDIQLSYDPYQQKWTVKSSASHQGIAPYQKSGSSLPPDWETVVEPSSKRTYYFNRKTKESSWKWPCLENTEDGTSAGHDNSYGLAHRDYCIAGVAQHKKISVEEAAPLVDAWFAGSKKQGR